MLQVTKINNYKKIIHFFYLFKNKRFKMKNAKRYKIVFLQITKGK